MHARFDYRGTITATAEPYDPATGIFSMIGTHDHALGGDVLRPAVIMAVVDGVLEGLTTDERPNVARKHQRELASVSQEIDRLTEAIAVGGPMSSLLEALRARQDRRTELLAELAAARDWQPVRLDRKAIESTVTKRLTDWRGLLTEHVADGRELLRRTLTGPLRFTPDGSAYRFEGEAAIGRLLEGVIPVATKMASPEGFEPSLPA